MFKVEMENVLIKLSKWWDLLHIIVVLLLQYFI